MTENQGVASSILAWATSLSLVFAAAAGTASAQPAGPHWVYSRAPDQLLARLSMAAGEVGGDAVRTVHIYGDGRVRARYPAYLKNAGERETRLSRAELEALMRDLAGSGLPGFDPAAVRAQCAALESQSSERVWVAGADWIEIELHLEQYRGAGESAARPVHKKVAWRGLSQDVERFPSVAGLSGLAVARDRLAALLAREDLAGLE